MNWDKFDFFFKDFGSYEEFYREVGEEKWLVIQLLDCMESEVKRLRDEEKRATGSDANLLTGTGCSYFFTNLLYLYRWILSAGHSEFFENQVDNLFNFLCRVRVPDFTLKKVPWAAVFLEREGGLSDKDYWKDWLLSKSDLQVREPLAVNNVLDLWMMYHVGLKQLFQTGPEDKRGKVSGTREAVLMRYLNLVDEYPELELVFGVAIEKDMHRIFMWMTGEKHA